MSNEILSGKQLKLIETDDINKVPFSGGQYIIVDGGMVYYDPTIGVTLKDRQCLTPKHEVDVYIRDNNETDEYFLSLQTKPINGDIVIIKDIIPNSDKYSYTVYMYNDNDEDTNGVEWCKLTGYHDAKNVYFSKDMDFTLPIEGLNNGEKVIESAGKNLEEVFTNIFSPEITPKIVQPSVELLFPEAGAHEIGTIVTPTYSMTLNPGEYEFGPNTEVTAKTFIATSSNGDTRETQDGSFPSIIVDKDTNFKMSASIIYSQGAIPLTNKGNEYLDGNIKSGSAIIESAPIVGYVNGLYYGCSSELKTKDNIDGSFIRTLNRSNKKYRAEDVKLSIDVGTKSIIIACPVDKPGLSKVINHTVNCDMTLAFGNPTEVQINASELSDDYANTFNVWIYSPAEPYQVNADLTISVS